MKVWLRFPALFYGLAFVAGIGVFYQLYSPLLIGLSAERKTRATGFYLIALFALLETAFLSHHLPEKEVLEGVGYYRCQKIRTSTSPLLPGFHYQGTLLSFISDGTSYSEIPCHINTGEGEDRPPGDQDYLVQGKLSHLGHGNYKMTVQEWIPIPNTHNFSEVRLRMKEAVRTYLKTHIHDEEIYWFFSSLATGEIENTLLAESFRRVGLGHTLAISGIHYSLLLMAIGGILSLFLSRWTTTLILLLFVSAYFFFIGESPSLNRAWMGANVYLIGCLIHRRSYGLNALGVSLLFSLIFDPSAISQIGYQFSYLATFAILALYPTLESILSYFLPIRDRETAKSLSLFHKHIFILSSYLRRANALNLAVTMILFPLIMFHFGSFPLLSFVYNILLPFILTVPLLTLLFGLVTPLLGPLILRLGEWYTRFWMDLILYGWSDTIVLVGRWFCLHDTVNFLVLVILLGITLEDRRYELTIMAARS